MNNQVTVVLAAAPIKSNMFDMTYRKCSADAVDETLEEMKQIFKEHWADKRVVFSYYVDESSEELSSEDFDNIAHVLGNDLFYAEEELQESE